MDATNPRWEPSELRRAHSATVWKLIVCGVAAAALSAIVTTTVLDHRGRGAPRTSTEGAPAALEVASATATARVPLPAGPEEPATAIVIAPSPDRSFVEARPLVDEAPAPRAPVATSRAEVTMSQVPEVAPDAGEAAAPRGAPTSDPREAPPPPEPRAKAPPADPNRGSNLEGPRMSAGAGRFLTEAPPWAASAMTSNPDAGAGRFSTEPPPWAGSAWTSDPNAGAGPFETERNRR